MARKKKGEPEEGTEKGTGKKGKSKVKLIGVAVVTLLVAGGAYMFLLAPKKATAASAKPKPVPGAVIPLDPIYINLTDGHVLQLRLALQAVKTATEPPDGSKALDLAISELSNRKIVEFSSDAGREKAKATLVAAVSKAYDGDVMDVYFTTFVMQ